MLPVHSIGHMREDLHPDPIPPQTIRTRLIAWRNRLFASRSFQRHAARNPLLRPIARRRARAVFDLVAGFTYTQTTLAAVESGLLDRLEHGPASLADVEATTGLNGDAAARLARAAAAIGLAEEAEPGWWLLGRHGAALQGNPGAIAMIRHHRLLYADLVDPLALLKDDRRDPTNLSSFWTYSAEPHDASHPTGAAGEYSRLMADSQAAVADEVIAAFRFDNHRSLLDVGGGSGTFLRRVSAAHPDLRLGLFDLPDVVALARKRFEQDHHGTQPEFHAGNFLTDSIPRGYDLVSLVRILHDHDDAPAQKLLQDIHRAMRPGAQLLVAEPMAATPGAEAMGDAYFGLYLWAMGSGRPRRAEEIHAMLAEAGFARSRAITTHQPLITSLIVATA